MVLGGLLMNSPIRMIFSLLLMQGISLTMFRTLLHQTMRHVDPLRFQLNLGNTNLTSPATGNSQSSSSNNNWSALFSQLLQSQTPVPTPAPLIDSKVVDLIHLLRSLQIVSTQMNNPSNVQTVPAQISAPIIAWSQVLSTSTTTTSTMSPPISNGHPQIIILPHYTTNTIERLHSNSNSDDSKMDASGPIPVSTLKPGYEFNSIQKRNKKIKKKKSRLNKKHQSNIELVKFNDEFSFGGHDDN